jgi:hypothetical protein
MAAAIYHVADGTETGDRKGGPPHPDPLLHADVEERE